MGLVNGVPGHLLIKQYRNLDTTLIYGALRAFYMIYEKEIKFSSRCL